MKRLTTTLSVLFILTACSQEPNPPKQEAVVTVNDSFTSAAPFCSPEGELTYLCNVMNAEDLLLLGNTGKILISGMDRNGSGGHLYLADPSNDTVSELIFDGDFSMKHDSQAYPNCPGILNLDSFSVHGLALDEYSENQFNLYITSHGEREAIEMFNINMMTNTPSVTWQGCVVLPEYTSSNSVVILKDGGFITTKMMDTRFGFEQVNAGEITGNLYEWHPGGTVQAIEGTELSGANGIALSSDERYMYVAALGSREVIKFDRALNPIGKEAISVEIVPDNVRWNDGQLLVAGGNVPADNCTADNCSTGWSVIEVNPDSMTAVRVGGADQTVSMQGISSALQVGDEYWVGTYNGDQVAHFPK